MQSSLEKEMTTHSSVLSWRIPGTGEPSGLPSMGSQQSQTRLKRLSSSSRGLTRVLSLIMTSAIEMEERRVGMVTCSDGIIRLDCVLTIKMSSEMGE